MRSLVGSVWPAIIVAVVGLVLWELIVTVFQIQKFLVPKPSAVAIAFVENFSADHDGLRKTGYVDGHRRGLGYEELLDLEDRDDQLPERPARRPPR